MVKVKLNYYHEWKQLRGVLSAVKKMGCIRRTSSLGTKLSNDFYNFCRENREQLPDNIVEAREMFYNLSNNVE